MANILVADAQSWLETTKTNLGATLDANLEASISAQVLSQLSVSYDVSGWTTPQNTPVLVKQIIAMHYAGWFYNRQYSEDTGNANDYALYLQMQADTLLAGVIEGSVELFDDDQSGPDPGGHNKPAFYPNDASSAATRDNWGNPVQGGPAFTMGKIF